jgi:hypothetical protein
VSIAGKPERLKLAAAIESTRILLLTASRCKHLVEPQKGTRGLGHKKAQKESMFFLPNLKPLCFFVPQSFCAFLWLKSLVVFCGLRGVAV